MTSLGLPPRGLRFESAPSDSVVSFLEKWGYLYVCSIRAAASSPDKAGRDDIPPIHPVSGAARRILNFTAVYNPVHDPDGARKLIERSMKRSQVFVYHVDLSHPPSKEELDSLKHFLKYLQQRDLWSCSLKELSSWWAARREVEIKCRREDDILVITYHNPTDFSLQNARLIFKSRKNSPAYYRVENRKGIMSSQGEIPDSGFLNVTFFPDEG